MCNENGFSPLLVASEQGHDSIVQHLIKNAADINMCNDKNGSSAFYIACEKGQDSTVQL